MFVVLVGKSDLDVFPVQLGGNVFGWTADEQASFQILDAFVAGGGNFVDSADVYSAWVPGNTGGDSERIIGNWMAARENRANVVIATKGASWAERPGASRDNILKAVDGSLERLQTDYIDLYYIHRDDPETPLEETVAVLDEVVKAGKVRHVAASNFSAERLNEALAIAKQTGAAEFVALQPPYSLINRSVYEGELEAAAESHGLGTLTYSSLAAGFLTGKYRDGKDTGASPRAGSASAHLNERGRAILDALDTIAANHNAPVASIALAWIRQRPSVAAPIASASSADQVAPLILAGTLDLSADEITLLDNASA
jgi:aryl-alcohol dehydrogenase-like predicted oxidoreductase